jgi:methylmalonyl-CoA/ethylmalonyl-CoA epimerase
MIDSPDYDSASLRGVGSCRYEPEGRAYSSEREADLKYSIFIRKYSIISKKGGKDMKVNKVDHICIAVKDLDEARKVWEPILGKSKPDDEYIDEPEKIKVARYWVGEVGFELMESTAPDGDVAKFIEKRGEGVMLISFNVDNTREAMEDLKQKDYPFIGGARPFRDCEFAFVHPKKMNGVLLELIDYKWKEFEER